MPAWLWAKTDRLHEQLDTKGCEKTLILHSSTTIHGQEYELKRYDDYLELLAEFDNIALTRNRQEQEILRLYEEITQLTQSLVQHKNLGTIRKINKAPFDNLSNDMHEENQTTLSCMQSQHCASVVCRRIWVDANCIFRAIQYDDRVLLVQFVSTRTLMKKQEV